MRKPRRKVVKTLRPQPNQKRIPPVIAEIPWTQMDRCPDCGGTGEIVNDGPLSPCDDCNGTGLVSKVSAPGQRQLSRCSEPAVATGGSAPPVNPVGPCPGSQAATAVEVRLPHRPLCGCIRCFQDQGRGTDWAEAVVAEYRRNLGGVTVREMLRLTGSSSGSDAKEEAGADTKQPASSAKKKIIRAGTYSGRDLKGEAQN